MEVNLNNTTLSDQSSIRAMTNLVQGEGNVDNRVEDVFESKCNPIVLIVDTHINVSSFYIFFI